MWHSLRTLWTSASARTRPQHTQRRSRRPFLEQLEDRLTPSNFTAATVSDLITDINAANQAGGSNTITLVAGKPFTLTAVDNATDGATGLPVIAANDNLTIVGNNDTIARSTVAGTPAFRLFDVASGASLTLENLTVQGGLAIGPSFVTAAGGGIYNQGTLDLKGVTVQNNIAQGQNSTVPGGEGATALGGGIYSSGTLTLEGGCKVQNNQAVGGQGGGYKVIFHGGIVGHGGQGWGGGLEIDGGAATLQDVIMSGNTAQGGQGGNTKATVPGGDGGGGAGGGVQVNSGTVTLINVTLSANTAQGGPGGKGGGKGKSGGYGGTGSGGGLEMERGTLILQNDIVTQNIAEGGAGGPGAPKGPGEGGGLYIAGATAASLDAFTVANVLHNLASTSNSEIQGSYQLLS
jgi:hypothetical protein